MLPAKTKTSPNLGFQRPLLLVRSLELALDWTIISSRNTVDLFCRALFDAMERPGDVVSNVPSWMDYVAPCFCMLNTRTVVHCVAIVLRLDHCKYVY